MTPIAVRCIIPIYYITPFKEFRLLLIWVDNLQHTPAARGQWDIEMRNVLQHPLSPDSPRALRSENSTTPELYLFPNNSLTTTSRVQEMTGPQGLAGCLGFRV